MKHPIEILYVVSTLKKTGPINLLYDIVKNIDNTRFKVSVLTLSPEESPSKEQDFVDIGVKVHKLNLSRIALALWGNRQFLKMIKQIDPDILHGHGLRPDYYISKLVNQNTYTTIHNYPHMDYPYSHGEILGRIMAKVQLDCIRATKHPIACSKAISDELKSRFGINSCFIRNGVDIEEYRTVDSSQKMELRKKYNIPQDVKVFISVGWLSERKNPLPLIQMFRKAKFGNSFQLIIIGKGDLLDQCIQLKTESIHLLGYVENLNDYLNLADYYISASKAEGMPCSVLQAMACGLPVLLSDIPPHREIWDLNPQVGVLFDAENSEDLLKAYNGIQSINQLVAGQAARKTVEAHFSTQHMTKMYENMYSGR